MEARHLHNTTTCTDLTGVLPRLAQRLFSLLLGCELALINTIDTTAADLVPPDSKAEYELYYCDKGQ